MTMKWRWALTLGAAVLVGLMAIGYVVTRPGGWRAEAVVAFAPKGLSAGADLLQLTADKYVAYMGSPALQRRIAPKVAGVEDSVRVTRDSETANVRVAVTLGGAVEAADFANKIARDGAAKAATEQIVTADVIAPAVAGAAGRTPQRAPYLLAGVLLTLFAGALTWYVTGDRKAQ